MRDDVIDLMGKATRIMNGTLHEKRSHCTELLFFIPMGEIFICTRDSLDRFEKINDTVDTEEPITLNEPSFFVAAQSHKQINS